jgi:hypothetical protein
MFRSVIAVAAMVASVSSIAQALPLCGVARYGQVRFAASESVQAIPSMPLWATITLAVALVEFSFSRIDASGNAFSIPLATMGW